ncbi:pyruvate kinase 2, cytosolic-like [Wolffia australiana]
MQGGRMLMEESVRLSTVLTPSKLRVFSSLTKIIATLGPKSRSVEVIESCLNAGMSVARFDFSWLDTDYHQETLENLRKAVKNVKKLCAVMVDTVGPEIQICNDKGLPIELKTDDRVTITPDLSKDSSSDVLLVNYTGLAKAVEKGDTIFVGQYLFTGSETTSVWLEVIETNGEDVICLVKNTATLTGLHLVMHVAKLDINVPSLTDADKKVISTFGSRNSVDILALSYTRKAQDVQELRAFLDAHNLSDTQIYAKIETIEGLKHFDDILREADGIILSRGSLGIDLPPEKVFLFQKAALHKCNMMGKTAIVTRVVDTMTDNLRPTRAEATDVANAVLDGADGILLGAETLRGLYPVEAVRTVGRICAEAEIVYDHSAHFKSVVKHVGEPMTHLESVASSAVRAAFKVKAAVIVVLTMSGRAARLIAKYRPTMPVLAVVVPRLRSNSLKWSFSGAMQARQCLVVRGVYPVLASPSMVTPGESELGLALNYAKSSGLVKAHDRVVVFQKVGDSSVVEIRELLDA